MLSQWSLQFAARTERAVTVAEETLEWSCDGIPRSGLVQPTLCEASHNAGKINFYFSAIDDIFRHPNEFGAADEPPEG